MLPARLKQTRFWLYFLQICVSKFIVLDQIPKQYLIKVPSAKTSEAPLLKRHFPSDSTVLTVLKGFVLDPGSVSVAARRDICSVKRLKAAQERREMVFILLFSTLGAVTLQVNVSLYNSIIAANGKRAFGPRDLMWSRSPLNMAFLRSEPCFWKIICQKLSDIHLKV